MLGREIQCHITNKSTTYNEVKIDFYTFVNIGNNDNEIMKKSLFGEVNRLHPDQKPWPRPSPIPAHLQPTPPPSPEPAPSRAPGTWKHLSLWNLVGFTWLAQLGSEDLPWMLFGILRNPPSRAVETELVIRITAAAPVLVGWRMLFQTCCQCFHQSWTQPLPFLRPWTCLTSSLLDPHPPLPKPFHTSVI